MRSGVRGITFSTGRKAEPFGQRFTPGLVADMRLPLWRVGGGAGHHNFHDSLPILIAVPVWTQLHQLAVEIDTDPPAHADYQCFASHDLEPLLEMGDDVLGNELEPSPGPDNGLLPCPLSLEPLLVCDLFPLGHLFEIGVDLRSFVFVEGKLGPVCSRSRSGPSPRPRTARWMS